VSGGLGSDLDDQPLGTVISRQPLQTCEDRVKFAELFVVDYDARFVGMRFIWPVANSRITPPRSWMGRSR
jgi:hypothetical protein